MRSVLRLSAVFGLFGCACCPLPSGAALGTYNAQLPPQAVVGSTPDRLAAYNSMSADEQRAVQLLVQPYLQRAFAQALAQRQTNLSAQDLKVHAPNLEGWFQHDLSQALGLQSQLPLRNGSATTNLPLYPTSVSPFAANAPVSQISGSDLDHDGLPDSFENQLADLFTPAYHVSVGETDNFATFFDAVPEAPSQLLGPHPLSYFRVKPLGFFVGANGVEYGAVQINYLTLWDHDSGFAISNSCHVLLGIASSVVGVNLEELLDIAKVKSAHPLDDEHSAALVAAPTVNGGFNLDPTQYSGILYYTAAHEGSILFDHSEYLLPATPIPANNHLELALSLAKHSTYAFNPDKLPMFPPEIVAAYYLTITDLWQQGILSYPRYLLLLYVGDTVFLSCVVEHFTDQGYVFASPRINVGEPAAGSTINGSGFILDPMHALPKLTETLWQVSLPPWIVTLNPDGASLDAGQSQAFGATVLNAPSDKQGVSWSISPQLGTITAAGVYTAPSAIPAATTVTVTACSTANSVRCGSGLIFLNPITVALSPKSANLGGGQTLQLAAAVTHGSSSAVTWSLTPAVGALSSSGLYTSPATVASEQAVTVKACSVLDAAQCDTATVTLKLPDFALAVAPGSQAVTVGGSTSYTVAVTPLYGFSGSVTFAATGLPAGVSGSFSPNPVSGAGSSTLSLATQTSAPTGATSFTITGSGSPGARSVPAILTLQPRVVILRPTTATANGVAYANPANAEDGSSSTFAQGAVVSTMSGEIWGGFGAAPGASQITLNLSTSASCGDPGDGLELVYSVDGGSTWLGPVYIMGLFGGACVNRPLQTDVITLPAAQDLSRVRVLAMLYSTGASSHRIYDLWIEAR